MLTSASAALFCSRGTQVQVTSAGRTLDAARASGFMSGCLIFHRPAICSITSLESQIDDTKKKLAASEGDREFLLKELKRLQAEKAELERKFNDLAVLRDQVRKLRDELSIARRLEWIRRGLYGFERGAERLQKGLPAGAQTNYDLNVEIKQSGGAKIVPTATNTPPATAPSPPGTAPAPPK